MKSYREGRFSDLFSVVDVDLRNAIGHNNYLLWMIQLNIIVKK